MKNIILYLYVVIIFLLSSTPPSVVESIQINGLDKVIHFIEYFILGIILMNTKHIFVKQYYYLIIIIPIIDEYIIQNYAGRNVDLFDFIANILGLLFGIMLWSYFFKS